MSGIMATITTTYVVHAKGVVCRAQSAQTTVHHAGPTTATTFSNPWAITLA